ncbi:citrulline utilization hydrolase CtlX [Roseivirga echinicomitans]
MSKQAAKRIMMMRPKHFGFDPSTARSNSFQSKDGANETTTIANKAKIEFDEAVNKLRSEGINVIALDDTDSPKKPNAVFPNNWVSFHDDGRVLLYPMMTESRRTERRDDVLEQLANEGIKVKEVIDFSDFEAEDKFLESTGSVVLDYDHKLAYACLSTRTHPEVLQKFCELMGFEQVVFEAFNKTNEAIYHTNVLMCLAAKYAIICTDAIPLDQRKDVITALERTGHEVVAITMEQMYAFAGNMLEVLNEQGESVLVMSESAMESLSEDQIASLSQYSKLLSVSIPTIEKFGGGSVRCMMCKVE